MAHPADALEVAIQLARVFDASGIEYALGGALALGVWGEARGTRDVDVTVYVTEEGLERVFQALQSLDADVERAACQWQLKQWGYFDVRVGEVGVDLFIPEFALHEWAYARRKLIPYGEAKLWFLSAEDTALFKLYFFRDKDKVDIKTLMKVQRENLDLEYIRKALREIFGDEEVSAWFEQAVRDVFGP